MYSHSDEDTPDSLEIKPPQSIGRYGRMKKSSRGSDKQHSSSRGDYRHKERSRPTDSRYHSNSSDRNRGQRDDRYDSRGYAPSSRSGSGGYEKSNRGDQYHHSNSGSKSAYNDRERDRERSSSHRSSSKNSASAYERKRDSPSKTDAERELDDLRSKLLSKRTRQDIERKIDEHHHYQEYRAAEKAKHDRVERRNDGEHRSKHKGPVEIIDSPENYGDGDVVRDSRDKKRTEDPELLARRAKLLDAEREMVRRKQIAREELKQRRELHRDRDGDEMEVHEGSESPKVHAKRRHRRRGEHKHSKRHAVDEDAEVVHISDNSDRDEDGEVDRATAGERKAESRRKKCKFFFFEVFGEQISK